MSEVSENFPKGFGRDAKLRKSQLHVQDFCRDLQIGDFKLSKLIKYGYILYGQSRVGKTCSCHLLSGNVLKGIKIGGEDMVQTCTCKYRKVKIGNTQNSQTRVPNFIEVKLPNQQNSKSQKIEMASIIDTPGYGDTNGVLRILGNGYYHYKLYSKVQNMKFILCFDINNLKGTANDFIDTIVQFTSYFKNYHENKHEIWKSCVFLITKIEDHELSFEDLKCKLSAIQQNIKQDPNGIKEFISYILKQERLFTIKKYKAGESAERSDLLKKIDKKVTNWWERPLDRQKPDSVDMSKIVFSVARSVFRELTKSNESKNQFIRLIDYYNTRIQQIVAPINKNLFSLSRVICQLVKDAMGEPNSHKFLDVMNQYVEKYSDIYDKDYKDERQKTQKQLFASETQSSSDMNGFIVNHTQIKQQKTKKTNNINYNIKKFNVLRNIQKMKIQLNKEIVDQKKIEMVDQYSQTLYKIIQEFNKICYKKINCTEIIYKYGYMIHRVISEAKVFLLLVGDQSRQESQNLTTPGPTSNKLTQAADGKYIALLRPLNTFMGTDYIYEDQLNMTSQKLQQEYVKKTDLYSKSFEKIQINEPLIQFLSAVNPDVVGVREKLIHLITKYTDQILKLNEQKLASSQKEIHRGIQRLKTVRASCIQLYQLTKEQEKEKKDKHFFKIRQITYNLGKMLQLVGRYDLARKVYSNVKFVDQVCTLYEFEIQQLEKVKSKQDVDKRKALNLRIQYGNYLIQHARQRQSIKWLQQAFALAITRNQLTQVKQLLSQTMLTKNNQSTSAYEQQLFQNVFFQKFDQQLQQQLEKLVKSSQCLSSEKIL